MAIIALGIVLYLNHNVIIQKSLADPRRQNRQGHWQQDRRSTSFSTQPCSFYVKARFFEGEDWKLLSGTPKF